MDGEEALIRIQDLSFGYGDAGEAYVIRNMNLEVYEGECLAVLGESGSGKSTLLKLICGLLKPDEGRILYRDKSLDGPDDEIAMIFQNYGLFPWKDVKENILLPLRIKGQKPNEGRTEELLDYLGLSAHARKYPGELSGGQKQRVALGRAVMSRSKLILMDEPFSALDIRNRERLQGFMKKLFDDMDMTAIIVTHSIDEAIVMGDRIAVFDPGKGQIMKIFDNHSCIDPDSEEYFRLTRDIRALLG